jgi:hypothetical protein
MKTYREVADSMGLIETKKYRYCHYMLTRWPYEEEEPCQDCYAIEWAKRFLDGTEYDYVDFEGLEILKQIDEENNK